MKRFGLPLLSLAFASQIYSANLPPSHLAVTLVGNSDTGAPPIQDIVIEAGLTHAKSDPKYAAILSALGIQNPLDLQQFIKGDINGSNFMDIIVHTAYQNALSNPIYFQWFEKMGIRDESTLRNFVSMSGNNYKSLIYSLALEYARGNPKYAAWLYALEIADVSDIHDIVNGDLDGTNFKDIILAYGVSFLKSNPRYQPYAFILSLIFGNNTLNVSSPGPLFLGVYDGLPVSEIKAIQKSKNKKVKAKT
jgi:hypothetical protein